MRNVFKVKVSEKDPERRQFILNVLLFCATLLSLIAFVVAGIQDYILHINRDGDSSASLFILFIIFSVSFYASKYGKAIPVAYGFIFFFTIIVSHAVFRWGADMPVGLLAYALLIVMSGILIHSRFAFILTFLICCYLAIIIYLQINGFMAPDIRWKAEGVEVVDGIIFTSIFFVIATVSWLFNREIEKALARVKASEAELKKERDSLAAKVEEKTKELRKEQAKRITEVYKFAEFGKSASGFLHDLSNAVNLVSANLTQLESTTTNMSNMQAIVKRARIGTKRLEIFINASRKQVNNQDFYEYFSLTDEIAQAIEIMNYRIKKAHVSITFDATRKIYTYGNPIKFHQLICNFIANGIDAYASSRKKYKEVFISLTRKEKQIILVIRDFGAGITKEHLPHIFEPFFTTKGYKKGMGIGLSISHDIVTKDFNGFIQVDSQYGKGSTFTITFPYKTKI